MSYILVTTLYQDLTCCWSRAARIAIAEKNIKADLADFHTEKTVENTLCPYFTDADGTEVVGGFFVLEYMNDAYPDRDMMGPTAAIRAETRRLTALLAEPVSAGIVEPLYKEKILNPRARRSGIEVSPFDSRAVRSANDAMVAYAQFIGDVFNQRGWLSYANFSYADAMAMGQISMLDMASLIPWTELSAKAPGFRNWYAKAKSRPAFRSIVGDRLPDVAPPTYYSNPDF
ncbi:MAG: glutathione S-transferase family protein [Alphaproteobacteria bacterium]